MRPALVSVRDQRALARLLATHERHTSTTNRNRLGSNNLRRHQGGGIKGAKDDHVQIWDGSSSVGDVLAGDASTNLFSARVRYFYNGVQTEGFNCWLGFVDWYDADVSQTLYALHGKHYYARRCGSYQSQGENRPFYVATQGNFECWCKADSNIAKGASGTVSLYNDDFTDSGINRASTLAKFNAVSSTKWSLLTRVSGTYIVQQVEC